MAQKQPIVYTFHKVRERCEQPDPGAWRAFVDFYSPFGLRLLEIYLPGERAAAARTWERTLAALAENGFERFRATARKSEREFLADIRALLLERAAEPGLPPGSAVDASSPVLTPEKLAQLLGGLPLLHQEMLFFKLAGYCDATLEKVFRIAPRVAQKAFERLDPDYAAARNLAQDRCLWPRAWLALLARARAARTDKCPERFQFLRIQDGQVSWYEKEPAETHIAGCLHCLEVWAALREVSYWRHAAPAVSAEQAQQFLRALPLPPEPKKPFFQRLFG